MANGPRGTQGQRKEDFRHATQPITAQSAFVAVVASELLEDVSAGRSVLSLRQSVPSEHQKRACQWSRWS